MRFRLLRRAGARRCIKSPPLSRPELRISRPAWPLPPASSLCHLSFTLSLQALRSSMREIIALPRNACIPSSPTRSRSHAQIDLSRVQRPDARPAPLYRGQSMLASSSTPRAFQSPASIRTARLRMRGPSAVMRRHRRQTQSCQSAMNAASFAISPGGRLRQLPVPRKYPSVAH